MISSGATPLQKTNQQSQSMQPSGLVIGVDIGGTNLRVAIADKSGKIIGRFACAVGDARSPASVVKLIRQGVDQIVHEHSLTRETICAIAAGAPGVTDAHRGLVIATSYLMGWSNVDLRALLEAEFNIPASVDNDVNLAALGEHWAGAAQGIADFVFLAIGTGIGAGIMLNGQLHHGSNWTAGEIGYMLVPGTSVEPAARGKSGALEELVGGEGIRTEWMKRRSNDGSPPTNTATATQILDWALGNDPIAQEVLQRAAQTLAYAIYNISLVLNPPLFLLGGTVGLHPALGAATRAVLDARSARVQPHLICSALGSDAQIVGAISLAIHTANERMALASH